MWSISGARDIPFPHLCHYWPIGLYGPWQVFKVLLWPNGWIFLVNFSLGDSVDLTRLADVVSGDLWRAVYVPWSGKRFQLQKSNAYEWVYRLLWESLPTHQVGLRWRASPVSKARKCIGATESSFWLSRTGSVPAKSRQQHIWRDPLAAVVNGITPTNSTTSGPNLTYTLIGGTSSSPDTTTNTKC